jgi:hypothetical protein
MRRLADKSELKRIKSDSEEEIETEDIAALSSGIGLELSAFTKSESDYHHDATTESNTLPTTTARLRHTRASHTQAKPSLIPLL